MQSAVRSNLVLLFASSMLAASAAAYTPVEFQGDYDLGYTTGYDLGYEAGLDRGAVVGEKTGRQEGKKEGFDAGWEETYWPAYQAGYDKKNPLGYRLGYDEAFSIAEAEGVEFAEDFLAGLIDETALYAVTPEGTILTGTRPRGPGGWGGPTGSSLTISTGSWIDPYHLDKDASWHYDRGFNKGEQEGNALGYELAYDAAFQPAYAAAFDVAIEEGRVEGEATGYLEGGLQGFDDGWESGVEAGDLAGFVDGFGVRMGDAWNSIQWNYAGSLGSASRVTSTQFFFDRTPIDPWSLRSPVPEPSSALIALCLALPAVCRRS